MAKAGRINSLLCIHSKIDDIYNRLEHGGDNRASTRTSRDHEQPTVLCNNGRCHAGQWTFAGLSKVRRRPDKPIGGRQARSAVEISQLVIEQETATRDPDSQPITLL